jgi:CubicO group peptidase (beta-lactamase class C family)
VTDLFNHRSGLSGNAGNDLEDLGFDRATILSRLHYLKPTSSFRAGYAYSNFGSTEGAVAAAKATGKSWEEISEEKLYKPLGMSSTSSRYSDFLTHENRAELHVPVEGKWTALVKRDPDPQAPAGGMSSDARDVAQWMQLELGNGKYNGVQLIKEEAIAPTHEPLFNRGKNPVTGSPSFYGRGWNIDFGRYGTVWGHAGAFSQGARTLVELLPSEQLGIVVLANAFQPACRRGSPIRSSTWCSKARRRAIGPPNGTRSSTRCSDRRSRRPRKSTARSRHRRRRRRRCPLPPIAESMQTSIWATPWWPRRTACSC